MLKLENDALRDDVAAGVVGCTSKQSVSRCIEATASVDNAASRLADTAEQDYFTLREGNSLCKNNWKEPRSILMSSADRLPISMGNSCNYCEQYARASECEILK